MLSKEDKILANFGWSPSSKFFGTLTTNSRNYARGGSVYIGKVPRSSVVKTNNKGIVVQFVGGLLEGIITIKNMHKDIEDKKN